MISQPSEREMNAWNFLARREKDINPLDASKMPTKQNQKKKKC